MPLTNKVHARICNCSRSVILPFISVNHFTVCMQPNHELLFYIFIHRPLGTEIRVQASLWGTTWSPNEYFKATVMLAFKCNIGYSKLLSHSYLCFFNKSTSQLIAQRYMNQTRCRTIMTSSMNAMDAKVLS